MYLATTDAANALLKDDPLALLIGMLLDQQVTMEKAFTSPFDLAQRMGVARLDAAALAGADPESLIAWFVGPPALHRYPKAMAQRTQALCQLLLQEYDGDAAAVWQTAPTGAELVTRLRALPGFGPAKAQIMTALLAKQYDVCPPGWQAAAGEYAEPGFRSVADVVDADSLRRVREHKSAMKAAAQAAKADKTAKKPTTTTKNT